MAAHSIQSETQLNDCSPASCFDTYTIDLSFFFPNVFQLLKERDSQIVIEWFRMIAYSNVLLSWLTRWLHMGLKSGCTISIIIARLSRRQKRQLLHFDASKCDINTLPRPQHLSEVPEVAGAMGWIGVTGTAWNKRRIVQCCLMLFA